MRATIGSETWRESDANSADLAASLSASAAAAWLKSRVTQRTDLETLTSKSLRAEIERWMKLPVKALHGRRAELDELVLARVTEVQSAQEAAAARAAAVLDSSDDASPAVVPKKRSKSQPAKSQPAAASARPGRASKAAAVKAAAAALEGDSSEGEAVAPIKSRRAPKAKLSEEGVGEKEEEAEADKMVTLEEEEEVEHEVERILRYKTVRNTPSTPIYIYI